MHILIIHRGFPGQFKHLIPALQKRGDEVWAISLPKHKNKIMHDVNYAAYKPSKGNGKDTFHLVSELESKIIRGEAVATVANKLRRKLGFYPDLIIGHPGWGEMLFLADIWPKTPQLHYVEFYHGVAGTDNDISDIHAKTLTWEDKGRARIKNMNHLVNLNQMNEGLCPTQFQHKLLPEWAQAKTTVIHDGIDTDWLTPDSAVNITIPDGPLLDQSHEIITFINRTFEPYRGIHIFMKALLKVQERNSNAQVILVGRDTPKVSYGANRSDNQGWLSALREQLGERLDWDRIHVLDLVKHSTLRKIYQISSAHVYLTYPFVLSWSMLEAMSCGALVVGSDTAPVKEVITTGENGFLVPFEDSEALALRLLDILGRRGQFSEIKENARKHIIKNYKLDICLQKQMKLIDKLNNTIEK